MVEPSHDGPPGGCRIEGAAGVLTPASDAEICAHFREELIRAAGEESGAERFHIALKVIKGSTIEATISDASQNNVRVVPPMAIDVSDRSLTMRDVVALAQELGKVLARRANDTR
ncbi:MAG: hypothetical protein QNI87_10810 [Erythrobacter sp.]|uniref:hypothetical protein n=1 Tax=Erythrobacter sp. TaxID=1042 RepID=UPI00261832A6|nr:hypothetical protein [Erythrobacter sp.]MDJ0979010.1 hypothetical protein [Erythrobacter sp.]